MYLFGGQFFPAGGTLLLSCHCPAYTVPAKHMPARGAAHFFHFSQAHSALFRGFWCHVSPPLRCRSISFQSSRVDDLDCTEWWYWWTCSVSFLHHIAGEFNVSLHCRHRFRRSLRPLRSSTDRSLSCSHRPYLGHASRFASNVSFYRSYRASQTFRLISAAPLRAHTLISRTITHSSSGFFLRFGVFPATVRSTTRSDAPPVSLLSSLASSSTHTTLVRRVCAIAATTSGANVRCNCT